MKLLSIVVKPHVVPRLASMLSTQPRIGEVVIKEVQGYGRQKSYLDEYRGSEYSRASIPKVMVEVLVRENDAEGIIGKIVETTRTGRMGDGKIFVFDDFLY